MDLATAAAEQGGVFARAQATSAGYSPRRIKRRLESGEWITIHPQVYAAGSTDLSGHGLLWAAFLAAGPGAVVSHPAAARLHGIWDAPSPPWITVPPERHLRLHGVRLVRVPLDDEEIHPLNGMLLTGRERTVIDCLCVLPFPAAVELLDRVIQKKWMSPDALARRTHEHLGRRGAPQLRRLMRYAASDARFEAERRLHALLRGESIRGWQGNAEVRDAAGNLLAVADVLFARLRLVLEVDGRAHHSAAERFQRDRQRQNALVAAGYTVLRFTWYDIIHRPGYVLASIRDMVVRLSPAA